MTRPTSLRERLFSKLIIDPSGCVLWTGTTDRDGYGQIRVNGRYQKVHRVMYELLAEPIPEGLQIDHVKNRGCAHRNCANVAHLEPVTTQENTRRGNSISQRNAAKTRCNNNHLFDEANTYVALDGSRHCRTCSSDSAREQRRKRAAGRVPDPDPGRHNRGERNANTKLTAGDVVAIRARFAAGSITPAEATALYGFSVTTFWNIIHRRTWGHV